MKSIFLEAFVFMCAITGSLSARDLKPEVERAILKGAKAKIILKVHDDKGDPVPEANVCATFAMMPDEYEKYGRTDTNGIYIAEGKTTGGYVKFLVGKEGYYLSELRVSYSKINEEHDVVKGKWQPYGDTVPLKLKRKRAPITMSREPVRRFVYTSVLNAWVGYDLEERDFVAPGNKGKKADFEVRFNWDGKTFSEYTGMTVELRFTDPLSGFCPTNVDAVSVFKGPYNASSGLRYMQSEYFFSTIMEVNNEKIYSSKKIDKKQCWVIRSRCLTDNNNNLVSFHHAVIYDIEFGCKTGGIACFYCDSAFNSLPKDTNLEDAYISRLYDWENKYCIPPEARKRR